MKQISVSACLLVLLSANVVSAQEFSADAVGRNAKGDVAKSKIYVEREMVRVEPVGAPSYELLNAAQGTGYFVVPSQMLIVLQPPVYAKQNIAQFTVSQNPCAGVSTAASPVSCRKIGEEAVIGRRAEKWLLLRSQNGKQQYSTLWVDRSLHTVLKTESTLGSFALANVRVGKQPPNLFVLPATFKRVLMNGALAPGQK